jgi:hypothetical protein
MRKILALLLFFSVHAFGIEAVRGQDSTRIQWEAQVLQSVSFTGAGTAPAVGIRLKNFQLHAGPRFVWSNAFTLNKTPFGLALGLSYYPNGNVARFPAYIMVDYQSVYIRQYCPDGLCNKEHRRTDEISLGYGFRFPMGKRFDVSTGIHFGVYRQQYQTINELAELVGYSGMFRFGLHYRFYDL